MGDRQPKPAGLKVLGEQPGLLNRRHLRGIRGGENKARKREEKNHLYEKKTKNEWRKKIVGEEALVGEKRKGGKKYRKGRT